jgi:hypothetical protein
VIVKPFPNSTLRKWYFYFCYPYLRVAALDKAGCVEAKLNHRNSMRKFEFRDYRDPRGPMMPEIKALCSKIVKLPRSQ